MVAVMIALPAVQVVLREVLEPALHRRRGADALHADLRRLRDLPYVVASGANIRLEEGLHLLPHAHAARHPGRDRRDRRGRLRRRGGRHRGRDAAQSPERHADARHSLLGVLLGSLSRLAFAAVEFALQLWKALAGARPTSPSPTRPRPTTWTRSKRPSSPRPTAAPGRGADDLPPPRRLHGELHEGWAPRRHLPELQRELDSRGGKPNEGRREEHPIRNAKRGGGVLQIA